MKQILVSNLYIRPSSQHEILINDPYNLSSNQAPIEMAPYVLKSIRKSLKSSQGEFNVGELWDYINNSVPAMLATDDMNKMVMLNDADTSIFRVREQVRIEIFVSTPVFVKSASRVV